jgi:hypothetical protein
VEDVLGIDGEHVDSELLQIPCQHFQAMDLTKPFRIGGAFDLAVSLEVAEHLPANCALAFVNSLVDLAPLVLFSAAIPHQGGNNHLNEQWPEEWAALFETHDYFAVDFVRKRIWHNEAVEWWYAQNTLLFARSDVLAGNSLLKAEFEATNLNQLSLVHPKQYIHQQGELAGVLARPLIPPPSGLKEMSELFWVCMKNAVKKRLGLPVVIPGVRTIK